MLDAAKRTTLDDPLLPLPSTDYWYYLNAVLNDLSKQFVEGQLRRVMGLLVRCERFLICLTSEADGGIRMRKVRAMVIAESILTALPETEPVFESSHHGTRWKTLCKLASSYGKSPEKFIRVELCTSM